MFKRKVKRLQDENTDLKTTKDSLRNQRDELAKENHRLRVQIADNRAEYEGTLDAKEHERLELCDELAKAKAEIDALKARLTRQGHHAGHQRETDPARDHQGKRKTTSLN